jgi:hypothetical protein
VTGPVRAFIGVIAICAFSPGTAQAAVSANLGVSVSPVQLGASTTLSFGFTIDAGGTLPPALTVLDVGLPAGMGVDLGGIETCAKHALIAHGRTGCSSNSQVGTGTVVVRVPLGEVTRTENAALTVFNGPHQGARATLLFYAAGRLPIATQLVFAGVIVVGPRGRSIDAAIPLIPTLPEAPDAAIVAMSSTLSTRHHTYYRTIGGRRVRIAPRGAVLPTSCPTGGFQFAASFGFDDGTTAAATATVACPH